MNLESSFIYEKSKKKLEAYCAYQERCHKEVVAKLWSLGCNQNEVDEVVFHLITNNYLNEERFALLFSISKFHQKFWGKIRIKNELKARQISDFLITKALKEIPTEEYFTTFEILSDKQWKAISEKNILKKCKKFCDYLLRKGWESELIYEKVKLLQKE